MSAGDYEVLVSADRDDREQFRKRFGRGPLWSARVSVPAFFVGLVSLPLAAFVFCVAWTVAYDFDAATATHCRVENFLPSISAAIDYWPQGVVWRIAIATHFPGRLIAVTLYWRYYSQTLFSEYLSLSRIACLLHFVENVALLGLSFFTSDAHFGIHKGCFVIFLVTSMLYMCLSLWINAYGRRRMLVGREERAFFLKKWLFAVNLSSCAFSMYFYRQHNVYCFPMMYTWFCAFEYVVVVSNILFHGLAGMDMHRWGLILPTGETYMRC